MTTLNPTSAPIDQQATIDQINSTVATNQTLATNTSDFNIGEFATGIFNDYLHQNWAVNYGTLSVGGILIGKSVTNLFRDGLSLKDLKTAVIGATLAYAANLNLDDSPNAVKVSNAFAIGGFVSGILHTLIHPRTKVIEPIKQPEKNEPPVTPPPGDENENEVLPDNNSNVNSGDQPGEPSQTPPGDSDNAQG